jgi:2-keto-4-pentenoate hydratase
MNGLGIEELARQQLADYDAHSPGRIFEGGSEFLTVAEAYALQMRVAELRQKRGEPMAGYKIGCVGEAVRRQLGLAEPVFGRVFATEIHRSGALLHPEHFFGLAVEAEFAVWVAEDIPDSLWLRAHRNRAFAGACAVIELHNLAFRGAIPTTQELIANNALHAGAVLPAAEVLLPGPDELDGENLSVFRNGERLGMAQIDALPGGPFDSLHRLVEHLAGFGMRVKRNQIVLTGSPLPLYRVFPGDRIEVRCRRLPDVRASIQSVAR